MTFTKDKRGVAEVTFMEHENAFSTNASTATDTMTSAKLLNTITGYRYCLTDLIFTAATTTLFQLLENTSTAKAQWRLTAVNDQKDFHFVTPIMFATGAAVNLTIDATGATAYVGGYYKL